MAEMLTLLILLLIVMVFALLVRRIEALLISAPMVFTLAGWALGSGGLALVELELGTDLIHSLAEITLVLLLFTDAAHIRFADLRATAGPAARMLLIGMPLTILLGTLVIMGAVPGASAAGALLVAAILTPTDAALGQAFVTDQRVPRRVRQTVAVESGLNDGLALPIVIVAAMLTASATGGMAEHAPDSLPTFVTMQLALGPAAGLAVGAVAAKLLDWAVASRSTQLVFRGIYGLCTAFVAFVVAELVGGNGFIAAFVAGLAFGNIKRASSRFAFEFLEGQGQLLTIFAFVVFGLVLVPVGLAHISVATVLVSLSFLTFVRIVPIWLSLVGSGFTGLQKLCLGWFGPRGLASILFSLMVLERFEIAGAEEMVACVVLTVILSIVLHGMSAIPLARHLAERTTATPPKDTNADDDEKKTAPGGAVR